MNDKLNMKFSGKYRWPFVKELLIHGFIPSSDFDIYEDLFNGNPTLIFRHKTTGNYFQVINENVGYQTRIIYLPSSREHNLKANVSFAAQFDEDLQESMKLFIKWLDLFAPEIDPDKAYYKAMRATQDDNEKSELDKPFTSEQKIVYNLGIDKFIFLVNKESAFSADHKKVLIEAVVEARKDLEKGLTKRQWHKRFRERIINAVDATLITLTFSHEARETIYNICIQAFHFIRDISIGASNLLTSS